MKPKKLIHGVGINDADYVVAKRKVGWVCPFYRTWKHMLGRCYDTKIQERHPTYKGCTVSEEWLTFSNFRAWMAAQDWEDKHLDKDILFEGNKVYSPETCVFVSQMVNNFTIDRGNDRGEWLIGVYRNKPTEKFRSRCRNPFSGDQEHLGLFTCELEAHEAWLKRKLELAHELSAIQEDSRVAEALINRYSNYKTNN